MLTIGWGSYTTTGIFGDFMALIVAITMGASGVVVRYFKNKDLVPACLLGCVLAGIYSLPFEIEFNLNLTQIVYLSLMCFIILPVPFIILTIAPKYTPAYQVYLIFLLIVFLVLHGYGLLLMKFHQLIQLCGAFIFSHNLYNNRD